MSNLRDAIRAANDEKQNQQASEIPEIQKASLPENQPQQDEKVEQVEMVNLTIKVSREQRTHWLIGAKQGRTSLTAAITEALNARFGDTSKP